MGQTNVNTGGPDDGGFGAGMFVGIIVLIVIVVVLVLYVGPRIFTTPTNTRSLLDLLHLAAF